MAFRSDISVRWNLSPRVIIVASPSTEITVQDLHDTCRELEQRPDAMQYESLISSAGKEELGGGVRVGVTATLQNAVVSFEARKTWTAVDTITTADPTGVWLIDSTADLIVDGVEPGAWIGKAPTGELCSAIKVEATQILTDGVAGGWAVGDQYMILKVIQCEVSGGNLVAVDGDGNEMSPVLPTAGTQVLIARSSTATLQELNDIQYSSFNGGVTVDTLSLYSGTTYPIGTPRQPVNNLDDAMTIATERGFTTFYVINDLMIDAGVSYGQKQFVGASVAQTYIDISPDADVYQCQFYDCEISGTLDGKSTIHNCRILWLNFFDGTIEDSMIAGEITLSGSNIANILNCTSGLDTFNPAVNMGGAGTALNIRNYSGEISVRNKTGPELAELYLLSGKVELESTVTNGTIEVRGVGNLENETTGTADVHNYLVDAVDLQSATFNSAIAVDLTNGVAGTEYPLGTPGHPINNMVDAHTVAGERGITRFLFTGMLPINSGDYSDHIFEGTSIRESIVVVNAAASVTNCEFRNVTLTGTVDDGLKVFDSIVLNIANAGGAIEHSVVAGTIYGAGTKQLALFNCYSGGETSPAGYSTGHAIIDLSAGDELPVWVRDFSGHLIVKNKTDSKELCLLMSSGTVTIEDTVVAGSLHVSGVCELVNDAGPLVTSDVTGVVNAQELAAKVDEVQGIVHGSGSWETDLSAINPTIELLRKALTNRMEEFPGTPGRLILWDDDDTTPLLQWDLRDSSGGGTAASPGSPAKRSKGV